MADAPANEDADLVRAWQQGDAAAFAALVRRWQGPMARFLSALVGRADRVPDLCQEVFVRVFLAGPRYRETGAFAPWLYRIARNVALDECRRLRPQPQRLPAQELTAANQAPGSRSEQQELAEAVADALAGLPPELREVVVLRHYEGLTFPEMARLLGVPPSTLRCRFGVGMGRLRALLERQGWSPEEDW